MSDDELKKWNDAYSNGMRDGYEQGRADAVEELLKKIGEYSYPEDVYGEKYSNRSYVVELEDITKLADQMKEKKDD